MPPINRTGQNISTNTQTQSASPGRVFNTSGFRGDEAHVIEEIRYQAKERGVHGQNGTLSEAQLKAGIAGLRAFYADDASTYISPDHHPKIALALKVEKELLSPPTLADRAEAVKEGVKDAAAKAVDKLLGFDVFDPDGR
jgi:hypothetical protein